MPWSQLVSVLAWWIEGRVGAMTVGGLDARWHHKEKKMRKQDRVQVIGKRYQALAKQVNDEELLEPHAGPGQR